MPILETCQIPVASPPFTVQSITIEDTLALRHDVLWPDKPSSYVRLPEDDSGHHYGAFVSGKKSPVAIISLFLEEIPGSHDSSTSSNDESEPPAAARFRKFACDPAFQGQGIGTALLKHVASVARTYLRVQVLWCDARLSSSNWYENRGMVKFGGIFFKGPVEYVRMKYMLRTPDSISAGAC